MLRELYCFCCGEKKRPSDLSSEDETCLECGAVVELCEWDFVDEVYVPVPPIEE